MAFTCALALVVAVSFLLLSFLYLARRRTREEKERGTERKIRACYFYAHFLRSEFNFKLERG